MVKVNIGFTCDVEWNQLTFARSAGAAAEDSAAVGDTWLCRLRRRCTDQ